MRSRTGWLESQLRAECHWCRMVSSSEWYKVIARDCRRKHDAARGACSRLRLLFSTSNPIQDVEGNILELRSARLRCSLSAFLRVSPPKPRVHGLQSSMSVRLASIRKTFSSGGKRVFIRWERSFTANTAADGLPGHRVMKEDMISNALVWLSIRYLLAITQRSLEKTN